MGSTDGESIGGLEEPDIGAYFFPDFRVGVLLIEGFRQDIAPQGLAFLHLHDHIEVGRHGVIGVKFPQRQLPGEEIGDNGTEITCLCNRYRMESYA